MKKHLMILAFPVLAFLGCITQQERTERKELMKNAVIEAVSKRMMHIDITSMNSMRYGTRTVTSDFFLELHGDSVRSYLPYLGQAHQAPMLSPEQGLNFDKHIQRLKESHPQKDLTRLEIDVRTTEDSYQYTIELYDSGKAYIHVRSQHRDPISFDGELTPFQSNR